MYTDRPISGETVDTGVDSALSAPSVSRIHSASVGGSAAAARSGAPSRWRSRSGSTPPSSNAGPADSVSASRGYLDPASTTERLRLLWSTGARDVTLVAPGDGEGHRQPGAIDPRGWIA